MVLIRNYVESQKMVLNEMREFVESFNIPTKVVEF